MDKEVSMDILEECINWLQNASPVQIETMRNIYKEEKKAFVSKEEDIEILLPPQMKMDKNILEEEMVNIPNRKVKAAIENDVLMNYCNKEFNEASVNNWEYIAA